MLYYNHRDDSGRFTLRAVPTTFSAVPGRLYGYRGTVVRAGRLCRNGKRHVSFHKLMHGFVNDEELEKIDAETVHQYLSHA